MTAARTVERIDAYWSSFFGCRTEELTASTLVVPHVELGDYLGVFLLRRGPACLVSAPAPTVAALSRSLGSLPPEIVFDAAFLLELFGEQVERIIGPAWYGHVERRLLRPAGVHTGRLLDSGDEAAFHRLAEYCDETEREHSGLEFSQGPLFGCFRESQLVATAGYRVWGGELANIGVLTHPAHRGRGYGRSVVSGITAETLDRGLVPHYRALHTNHASLAVARALGFHEYASSLAVRFRGGSDSGK